MRQILASLWRRPKAPQIRPLTPCGWVETDDLARNIAHYRDCHSMTCRNKYVATVILLRIIPYKCNCPNCVAIRTTVN